MVQGLGFRDLKVGSIILRGLAFNFSLNIPSLCRRTAA